MQEALGIRAPEVQNAKVVKWAIGEIGHGVGWYLDGGIMSEYPLTMQSSDHDDAAPGQGISENPKPGTEPAPVPPVEHGGPPGPEPTRFGDWERKGRCIDF